MGGITEDLPKAMLEVRGRPMLEFVLEQMGESGIEEFLLVVGYRRETIESHFRGWPRPIEFCVQEVPNGTASAARLARRFAGHAPFLLTFGDILCEPAAYVRCAQVMAGHPRTMAVLGVRDVDDPWQGAAVYERGGRVTKVIEKPPRGTSTTRWNSAGLYAMQPGVFDYLDRVTPSARNEYELTSIFETMLAEDVEVRISAIEGLWRDVGRPEDLEAVNRAEFE